MEISGAQLNSAVLEGLAAKAKPVSQIGPASQAVPQSPVPQSSTQVSLSQQARDQVTSQAPASTQQAAPAASTYTAKLATQSYASVSNF